MLEIIHVLWMLSTELWFYVHPRREEQTGCYNDRLQDGGHEGKVDRSNKTCTVRCVLIRFMMSRVTCNPLPPLDHIRDVMLVWRKGSINRTVSVLQCCVPL